MKPNSDNLPAPDNLKTHFSTINAYQLIASGPYDELYRVRDLEEDVWFLGRFYFNPVNPDKLQELQSEFERCRSVDHDRVVPATKLVIEENRLAILWSFREGTSIGERLHREFGPRKIVEFMLAIADAIQDLGDQQVRMEYLSFADILVDLEDMPILMAGAFSHHLQGKGDTTGTVEDYQQRMLNRLGAVLLSICFGRHYEELIEAVKLETDVIVLLDRFRDLMGVDPSLMAIIAKCLMPIDSRRYQTVNEMQLDLEEYLNGRAVTVDGVDFHQMILSWRHRNRERNA